eukprot:GHVU01040581.1.p1 GENE.GHVU01040581.1~~GHVU01040581.1.p1  ORF type:complete len:114 (-),score=2.54 GHVU01040581.1:66-407(-)
MKQHVAGLTHVLLWSVRSPVCCADALSQLNTFIHYAWAHIINTTTGPIDRVTVDALVCPSTTHPPVRQQHTHLSAIRCEWICRILVPVTVRIHVCIHIYMYVNVDLSIQYVFD